MTPLNYFIIFGGRSNQSKPWSNLRTNLLEFLEKNDLHKNLWKFYPSFFLESSTSSSNFRIFGVKELHLKILLTLSVQNLTLVKPPVVPFQTTEVPLLLSVVPGAFEGHLSSEPLDCNLTIMIVWAIRPPFNRSSHSNGSSAHPDGSTGIELRGTHF